MATGQKLRGLVGQNMSGRRTRLTAASYSYPAGSYTWTCPTSGWWRFVLWGAGGAGATGTNSGGGSGALYIAERYMIKSQTVALVVGAVPTIASSGDNSTATFPNGEVITAGGGSNTGTGGTVTANKASDIVYAGSAGGATTAAGANGLGDAGGTGGAASGAKGGGAGAPGYGSHRGGDGATADVTKAGECPAAGGTTCIINGSGSPTAGGEGLALIYRVRLPV